MIGTTSVRRRILGGVLRAYRLDQGLAVEGAASILDCDPSKISRIETGVRGIRATELNELLTEYGVGEPERAALATIGRPLTAGGWWHGHSDVLTKNDREYFHLEAIADQIEVYEPQLVPALLQTAAYAEAAGEPAPDGALAALTLARQRALLGEHAVLGNRSLDLIVLIDEAVPHRPVGGPGVMYAQLHHLAQAAAGDVPGVALRVLPFSGGVRAAGTCGPVTILRFANAPRIGVVHLPRPGRGGTCLVGRDDLTAYTRTLEALASAALTPARSAQLLHNLADTYGSSSDTEMEAAS